MLYDWPESSTLLKLCIDKKEAQLERKALAGQINVVMAIFSLKQQGWSDRTEQTHKEVRMSPEDMNAHLEQLSTNLKVTLRRAKAEVAAEESLPQVPCLPNGRVRSG